VLYNEWSEEGGLITCYDQGLKVYSRSLSGLEFALRDVERHLAVTAIQEGAQGMSSRAPALAEQADAERARDESHALFDAASFERTAADRYWRVSQSEQTEEELESAFVKYFQRIGPQDAARNLNDPEYPGLVWQMSADSVNRFPLPLQKDPATDRLPEFKGTFRRSVAQGRPDLDFFSVGHVLFDALIDSLMEQPVGRTFAIECTALGREPWIGFELAFRALPNLDGIRDNLGLMNRVRQLFQAHTVYIYCRPDGVVEAAPVAETFAEIRRGLRAEDKDRIWWNLTKEKASSVATALPGRQWESTVLGVVGTCSATARVTLAERLHRDLEAEEVRLSELARPAAHGAAEGDNRRESQQEAQDLDLQRQAIAGWRVSLDSIGFLSINGSLHSVANASSGQRPRRSR
jgi:ATP-dependent helicase HepA